MTKKRKIIVAAVASLALLLLFSATILPVLIRDKARSAMEQATGRRVQISSLTINPLTLTVALRGLVMEEQGSEPLLSIEELRVSLSVASIFRRALLISEVALKKPSLSFSRSASGIYNFNDIIKRLQAKPQKQEEKKESSRFSVNNITVADGSITFDDLLTGGRHTVRKLEIAIPFISNMPYLIEKYTAPRISAIVDNAPFTFNGKLKPLSRSMQSSVHIDLQQLSLPKYLGYAPVKLPVDLQSGLLSINADIDYVVSADNKPELSLSGLVKLDNTRVDQWDGQPLLRISSFRLDASKLEVFTRRFLFRSIDVDGPELFVSRDRRGNWMYSRFFPPGAKPAKKEKEKTSAAAPLVQVSRFSLQGGTLNLKDDLPPGGFRGGISRIQATVKDFSTTGSAPAACELSMLLDNQATLQASGTAVLSPLQATVAADLSGLRIERSWPYLAGVLTSPVKGNLDLSLQAAYSSDGGLNIQQGNVAVTGLTARYGDNDGVQLSRLEIHDLRFQEKESRLEIGDALLARGDVSISREKDGSLSPMALLAATGQSAKTEAAGSAGAAANRVSAPVRTAKKPFTYRVKRLRVEKLTAAFTDKLVEEQPRFTLKETSLSLSNLNGPDFRPMPFTFAATFNTVAPIRLAGQITPQPFHLKSDINVSHLPLVDFEPYLPDNLNVFILNGTIDAATQVDLAIRDGKPVATFAGNVGLRNFHSVDTVGEEDLLKWESLQLDGIQGRLEPFLLDIRQVALNNFYSRIIVRKDGTLNLQNLVEKEQPKPVVADTPPAVQTAGAAPPAPPGARAISIGAVTIQDGTLAITDNHLYQPFNTTFYHLGGRISNLSSEESRTADVDLRGNLDNHSPLQITGTLNPLRKDLFVDLKVSFNDIDLSSSTPYTGTFLGYTVEKGKLFLDLKYRIDKKALESENRIFIDQFTFGQRVDSDRATALPVKLGLALLKDRKDEIHLDVPVTGRTDDPRFSIWGIVWQALRNLVVKAATSPFSLLSSMFGGGRDFSSISFDPGSSLLAAREQEKLTALAKALADRPGIKMEILGFVDRQKDPEGYRHELLKRKLQNEKYLLLAKKQQVKEGEGADTLRILPEERSALLASVYRKEKFPKARNMLGMVKSLPDSEMEKLIIANTVIGQEELNALARERGLAVMNYLVGTGGLPAERLFLKNDDIYKQPEKEGFGGRVEFQALAR